ncbi:MAG: hypothetical protein KAQ65_05905 [Candidatus Thorarchaeota archaeon]|nr:hypothetical protein [Candidatus Thorarchaeota archaeon]
MRDQKKLKREALEVMEKLHLVEILEKYGDTRLVGSIVLELIVKLDIDIHVLLPQGDLMDVTNKITTELLNVEGIREVRITDYRKDSNGIKIGIDECLAPSGNWTIDIWLTKDWTTTGFEVTERINSALTTEQREIVLKLKQYYFDKGLLRDGISSLIYEAVLNGVSSVEEFETSSDFIEYQRSH